MWLCWPHDEITFPERLPKVEQEFVKIISALHESERVALIVLDEPMQRRAAAMLQAAGVGLDKITFHQTRYVDGWLRDCAPLFVRDEHNDLAASIWRFNAWGNKFPDLLPDAALSEKIASWLALPARRANLVLEGGAIEVNGQGVCLATEQCLLNPNRNGNITWEVMESYLKDYLGVQKTIWLPEGIVNDHTDGHIDEVARFVSENRVVCGYEEDTSDPNYKILQASYEILSQHFEVIKLPMPHQALPASYTNFYIGNQVVLAPVFGDLNDERALQILTEQFPGRKIVPIDCREIISGGGAVHCLVMQQPKP